MSEAIVVRGSTRTPGQARLALVQRGWTTCLSACDSCKELRTVAVQFPVPKYTICEGCLRLAAEALLAAPPHGSR